MTTKSKMKLGMALTPRLIWKLEHSISTKRRERRSKRPRKMTRENLLWRTSSNERKRREGRGCKHSQIRGVDRVGAPGSTLTLAKEFGFYMETKSCGVSYH